MSTKENAPAGTEAAIQTHNALNSTLPPAQRKRPNIDEAARFLRMLTALDEPGDWHTYQTFDDNKTAPKKPRLTRILHGKGNASRLAALNNAGAGIFVMVNRGDGHGREATNVTGVRAVFVDADKDGPAALEQVKGAGLQPHAIIESSPGKFQIYWFVTRVFPTDQFCPVQQALIKKFATDEKVKDLPRVLRLPGFYHLKNPAAPFRVRIVELHEELERYSLDEIVNGLALKLDESSAPEHHDTANNEGAIVEGGRNDYLSRKAYGLKKDGLSIDAIESTLLSLNDVACDPPLDAEEVIAIARGKRKVAPDDIAGTQFSDKETLAQLRREKQKADNERIGEGEYVVPLAEPVTLEVAIERFIFQSEGARVCDVLNPHYDLALSDWAATYAASAMLVRQPPIQFANGTTKEPPPKKVPVSKLWLASEDRKTVVCSTFKAGAGLVVNDPSGRLAVNSGWGSTGL